MRMNGFKSQFYKTHGGLFLIIRLSTIYIERDPPKMPLQEVAYVYMLLNFNAELS